MKTRKLWMLVAILTCGLGMMLTSCSSSDEGETSGGNDTPVSATGDVVLMYYAVGGGDLDDSTEQELGKFALQVSKESNVRGFVQYKYSAKRNSGWNYLYEPSGEYGSVYRFELNSNSLNPEYAGDVCKAKAFTGQGFRKYKGNDFKMYDPDNLVEFINWCMEQAPGAKAYVLAFADHGGAYDISKDYDKSLTRGVMYDDNLTGKPCMSPMEIRTALSKLTRKPDMIFFDCCIMSNLEVLGELQGMTNYVFASGHSVVESPLKELCSSLASAAKYSDIQEGLRKSMSDYVTIITNSMRDRMKRRLGERILRSMDYTLTDMSKMPALFASVKAATDFLTRADISGIDIEIFNQAASGCYRYVDDFPLIDVVGYLKQLRDRPFKDNAEFAALVSQVETAAKACHIAHDEFSYDTDGTDKKYDLTYSVTLGFSSYRLIFDDPNVKAHAPKEPQGAIMLTNLKEPPYYNDYLLENGDDFLAKWDDGQEMNFLNIIEYYAKGSGSHLSWDNTYRTTHFDKATGWSNWMKKNPGIYFDNPPYDDQYTYVYEKPTWDELTGE